MITTEHDFRGNIKALGGGFAGWFLIRSSGACAKRTELPQTQNAGGEDAGQFVAALIG